MPGDLGYTKHEHDVIVIGAGGAGLRAAIEASAAGCSVGLICKSLLGKAHTVMAEGGMAAAMANVDDRDNWKVHFATFKGNIATGVREVPNWPAIVNLRADPYEKAMHEADVGYLRWLGDNLWIFVPVQASIQKFLKTIPDYPFQAGSSLNAAGINYQSLKAMEVLKKLETLSPPGN